MDRRRPVLALALFLLVPLTGCKEARKRFSPPKKRSDTERRATPPAVPQRPGPTPHPDYPTPAAAGTEKIFYLEEPDRGPKVTAVTLPPRPSLKWRTSAHCEPHETGIACAAAAGPRWHVGSRAGNVVVAEHRGGAQVQETYLYERDGTGRLTRVSELDGRGLVSWSRFFDRSLPRFSARNRDGSNALSGCGHLAYKLGPGGHPVELSCLQWTGKPMRDTEGVRVQRIRRDRRGLALEVSFVTEEGEPMADNDGVHVLRYTRDGKGRVREVRYLDVEGKPAARRGCHGERRKYDARGLLLSRACLDAEGKPAQGPSGAHVDVTERDGSGCVILKRFLDGKGRPETNLQGVASLRFTVNPYCQTLSESCFSLTGSPTACGPRQPARRDFTYDHRGFLVSTKSYDHQGKPGHDHDYGVFEVRTGRDELGNATSESCFDKRGRPVECDFTGFHRSTLKVDDVGRVVERRFFDKKGAPATNLGCAIRRFRYDNYDHQVEAKDYDRQGQVIETYTKAVFRTLYDQSHRRFAELLFDKQGKPSRYTGCYTGVDCPSQAWHAVRIVRDHKGVVEKNEYFDAAGQLIDTADCRRRRCWE